MKRILLSVLVPALVGVAGCSEQQTNTPSPQEQTKQDAPSNFDEVYASITAEKIKDPLKTLSSDEFEGRLPTTAGEQKTIDFLVNSFKEAGFEPGNQDSFLQKVELMEITANPDMNMTIGENTFRYKEDMVASSKREVEEVKLQRCPGRP